MEGDSGTDKDAGADAGGGTVDSGSFDVGAGLEAPSMAFGSSATTTDLATIGLAVTAGMVAIEAPGPTALAAAAFGALAAATPVGNVLADIAPLATAGNIQNATTYGADASGMTDIAGAAFGGTADGGMWSDPRNWSSGGGSEGGGG